MTDQFTSLSAAALRTIIAKLDEGLVLLNERKELSNSEEKIKRMMTELRETLREKLAGMRDTP